MRFLAIGAARLIIAGAAASAGGASMTAMQASTNACMQAKAANNGAILARQQGEQSANC